VIWLWGLTVGLLLGTILGLVLAKWPAHRREHPGRADSLTDLGERFALVKELRREIVRLRQVNARLQADRTESRAALTRVANSLEREARRPPVQSIGPASGESLGTDTSTHQ
jgi:hypothetical protein